MMLYSIGRPGKKKEKKRLRKSSTQGKFPVWAWAKFPPQKIALEIL